MTNIHEKLNFGQVMIFDLSRFGQILSGRDDGARAFFVLESELKTLQAGQKLLVDVGKVKILNPSFADESLTPLMAKYPERVLITGHVGLAVRRSLETVETQRKIDIYFTEQPVA